ncbi:MAG: hypothetical protein HND58_05070 [Planctomycetota bacterium]|nr:MAG: hypothetical protein HND58_05070 [Planctomycetota bacterium]
MSERFGCNAFLGEDIPEFSAAKPRVSKDHLSIEVEWAERSDLIVMFLGSAGTISEITAFAMTQSINPKLLVFNDERYRSASSFLTQGPLRLLQPTQKHYYANADSILDVEVLRAVDIALSQAWYRKKPESLTTIREANYYDAMTLANVCALYPVRYGELREHLPWPERRLLSALKKLVANGLLAKVNNTYVPAMPLSEQPIGMSFRTTIARARARAMSSLLQDEQFRERYSRIQNKLRGVGRFRTA